MKSKAAPSSRPSSPIALAHAREALEAGRLEAAAEACRDIVRAHPAAADALSLLGEVEYARGQHASAREWLAKAVDRDRRHARSHWLLGNLDQDAGELERAVTSYRRALRADPRLTEAHNDLGTAYAAKGWHVEAEQCYREALALEPDNLAASENLAASLRAQGKLKEARDAFLRTLKLRLQKGLRAFFRRPKPASPRGQDKNSDEEQGRARALLAAARFGEAERLLVSRVGSKPDDADAHHLLGLALAGQGRRGEAIGHLEKAIALRSSVPEFYVSLGNVLSASELDTGLYARALEHYQAALTLDPGHAPAAANIARVLHALGHYREAEEVHRRSLEQDPDIAAAHSNFAGTLLSLGRYAEAEAAARRSLSVKPDFDHAMTMLAGALVEQGRGDEALETLRRAQSANPDSAQLLRALGVLHMLLDADLPRAEALLARARDLDPQGSSVHLNLARCLLLQERFTEGWTEYEWRKRDPARAAIYAAYPQAEWEGGHAENSSLLIHAEQGLGDEIMFAALVPQAAARVRRCVLLCNPRLEPLFKRSFPEVEVRGVMPGDPGVHKELKDIDLQIAAGSLARLFRRTSADFPAHTGYLKADPGKTGEWRARLAALGAGLKVGLSWKGGTPLSDATRRSLSLDALQELLGLHGIRWVNLQYGDSAAEREAFRARTGITLHHWDEAVGDLDESAALMEALDLRISVCNTQVHLSGALGKEVWVLAPLSPEWRYGLRRETMLWYPAARMFRQTRAGAWQPVIQQIIGELGKRIPA